MPTWKSKSLPFPEPGIRLIRQDQIETFDSQITLLKDELSDAVLELNRHYDHLKLAARRRLGSLYDVLDYPASLLGLLQVTRDYPSVEPPSVSMV